MVTSIVAGSHVAKLHGVGDFVNVGSEVLVGIDVYVAEGIREFVGVIEFVGILEVGVARIATLVNFAATV
jgi:hypothetical protein